MAKRLSLPFDDWPARDRALWHSAIQDGDILDGAGPCADWAETTRNNSRKAYSYWLQWLIDADLLDVEEPPFDRITPQRVAAYVKTLEARVASSTVFTYILDLLAYVKRVEPKRDWSWLVDIKNRLGARSRPARDKTQRIQSSQDLFDLGVKLMDTAAQAYCRYNRLAPEIQYRNGLIIAFLAARPIRLKNLAALEIDQHLVRVDGVYWLRLEAYETKNRKHIEATLPQALTPYLDCYLEHARKKLLGDATSDHLWVSCFGTDLSEGVIRYHLCKHTKTAFGKAISPHLFRDCAATSVAIEDPEHVRVATAILGHHSPKTAQQYYDQSRMLSAGRHYQEALAGLRNNAREQLRRPHKSEHLKPGR